MVARASGSGGRAGTHKGRKPDDDRPANWVGYGKLLKLFRKKAG
ncbi:hypothetical protein [Streptomyces sp. D54]